MKACVIGHPIKHSKSPIIHNFWLEKYNINGSYNVVDIEPNNLKDGIKQLIDQNYDGFNVTIPHKQNIINFCEEIDETAQAIGAVNTVIIKDKKLYGRNTDAYGFIENIKSSQMGFEFKNKTALVLGAGGAARAVIYGLLQEGVEKVIITNRTFENAQQLQALDENKIEVYSWGEKGNILNNIDILVNTTSLGMVGKPELELNLDGLSNDALVSDIVYSPLMTPLLKAAQLRGNATVTGIGMLIHQARPAFEAWTKILPDSTSELEAMVLK